MNTLLAVAIAAYLVVMFGIALWSSGKIENEEDYIVAGRNMPLLLTAATLLATWFGAGTLLTATDEIFREGLRVTALEPYGAGLCLLVAGFFFAKPLWEMHVCTVADIYKQKYGRKIEVWSVFITVPGYIGWIAVQLTALAGIIHLFFGLSPTIVIPAVALIATAYTLLGGMWSVAMTDAAQILMVIGGMLLLAYSVFTQVGDANGLFSGVSYVLHSTDDRLLTLVPRENATEFLSWLSVLSLSTLGNIAGQDLGQRIFSAKSAETARRGCILAGVLYIALGTVPAFLGLAAQGILPIDTPSSILPALAQAYLSPGATVLFMLALLSVVLSTIDSAILAPAATLARNALRPFVPARIPTVKLCQYCVAFIATASAMLALTGKEAYHLLEDSYAIVFVGLFVPFFLAIFGKTHDETAALTAMATGTAIWLPSFIFDTSLPLELIAVAGAFAAYFIVSGRRRKKTA